MFPKGESIESDVTVGAIWIHDDLIASKTFEVLKDSKQYENEKTLASQTILPIFVRDTAVTNSIKRSFKTRIDDLIQKINTSSSPSQNNSELSNQAFTVFYEIQKNSKTAAGRKITLNTIYTKVADLINNLLAKGLLSLPDYEIERDTIALRNGKFEKAYPKNLFLNPDSLTNYISEKLSAFLANDEKTIEAVEEFLSPIIKPNLIFSKQLTDLAIQNKKASIPRNIGIVNENERIVAKHDRITNDIKLKIESYRIAKGEELEFWGRFFQGLGKFIHIALLLVLFTIYIFLFRKGVFYNNSKILLLSSIILFEAGLAFLVYHLNISAPIEYLILIPVASMLVTIIFDSRLGFYATITIALIAGALRGNDYVFAVTNIIAGGLGAYTVRDIKNRTQIFRSFLYILIGYSLSIFAFGLERFDSLTNMINSLAFASSNALISPVLTYGLIIFVERIFGITTDLTFLELTDLNRPLLKELAKNAPGTFSHSVSMGTLVDTTAEALGANPILARVGAYYHDIGKISDPESFVENQINPQSIHDSIPPETSRKLILDHVSKGVEIARKYELPKEIIDFIPMHHGTMVISYFYEKARKVYSEENVILDDYRYLGPKPNTKETAIVMLADACESTVRSLTEADPQKVENIINNLINNRIDDGQLDDAPLTFNDIKKIKESFANILVGHHHRRIRYPKQEELESKTEE